MDIKNILKALLLIISGVLIGYFGMEKEEVIVIVEDATEMVEVLEIIEKKMSPLTGFIDTKNLTGDNEKGVRLPDTTRVIETGENEFK